MLLNLMESHDGNHIKLETQVTPQNVNYRTLSKITKKEAKTKNKKVEHDDYSYVIEENYIYNFSIIASFPFFDISSKRVDIIFENNKVKETYEA